MHFIVQLYNDKHLLYLSIHLVFFGNIESVPNFLFCLEKFKKYLEYKNKFSSWNLCFNFSLNIIYLLNDLGTISSNKIVAWKFSIIPLQQWNVGYIIEKTKDVKIILTKNWHFGVYKYLHTYFTSIKGNRYCESQE